MKKGDSVQIKVCGMRDPRNLEEVCRLEPDFVGFIFHPPSKRFVGQHPDPALFSIPGPEVKKVGVFVDEDLKQLRKVADLFGLQTVQLHGHESVEYCQQLSGEPLEVIKVLDPHSPASELERFKGVADLFLFDSTGAGHGGSGQKFDWNLLGSLSYPFFLSGGIGPGDGELIRSFGFRGLKGVDVNSRFEISPGLKNTEQLKEFIREIRK